MNNQLMISRTSTRWLFAAIGAICVALLGAAYFLQYGPYQQQPCPLCILQRYAYLAIALVALIAAVIGPERLGAMLVSGVLGLFAAIGGALAIWQVSKGDSMASCLNDPVGQFVYNLPMRNWWPEFLAAYGGCADKYPPIFGVSVPVWSLVWFAVLLAVCELMLVKLLKKTRRTEGIRHLD